MVEDKLQHCPRLMKRQQRGGGVMSWVCFVGREKALIAFFEEHINADLYLIHLNTVVRSWYRTLPALPSCFQHDIDPSHAEHTVKKAISRWEIDILPSPANIPGMNPIQSIWNAISTTLYSRVKQYTSKNPLETAISQVWSNMSEDYLESTSAHTWRTMVKVKINKGNSADLNKADKDILN